MLTIELYNQLRGGHMAATEHNLALINKLNSLGVTEAEVKAYRLPPGCRQHELRQMAADFAKTHKASGTPAATPAEPVAPIKEEKIMATGNEKTAALIEALNGLLAPSVDLEELRKMVDQAVEDKVKDVRPIKLEVKSPKGINVVEGTLHKAFEEVLTYVSGGDAVYLYGPAGSGKTHMAAQIAKALGLEFYYSGQLSQEYKFAGFTDANGHYQPTPFYKAWTKGGLYFFDEFDRSLADVCTDLNGALANGIFDFPAPIGTVEKHPDFRCLAAGNTIGRGATGVYVAANALDGSTLDRFMPVEMTYDTRVEDAIDKDAAAFVRAIRKASATAGLDIILSYRTITKLAKYSEIVGMAKILKAAITAPLSKDDVNILKRDAEVQALASVGNKYAKAFI